MNKKTLFIPLILVVLLASCTMPNSQTTPTTAANVVYTAAAQTVSARLTEVATEAMSVPTLAPATLEPTQTATLAPTVEVTSPPPITQNTAVVLPSVAPQVCDRATFVSDITIPDGTVIEPGENFIKTWRLKNSGTCTWTTDYDAVFQFEDQMDAPDAVPLPESVAPGETVDISIEMTAPTTAGEFTGYWKLRNDEGVEFDSGLSTDKTFYVQIEVETGTFAVTGVSGSVDPAVYNGKCNPVSLTFSADIRVNNLGTIQYHWIFDDNSVSPDFSLKFKEAGTKSVEYIWEITKAVGSYSGWGRVYIDDPNHQEFTKVKYTLTCVE